VHYIYNATTNARNSSGARGTRRQFQLDGRCTLIVCQQPAACI